MHVYIAMTRRGQPPKRIPKRSLRHNLLWLYLQSLANTVVTHVFNKKVTIRREWFEELGVRQLRNDAPQWAPTASWPQRRRLVRHTRRMRLLPPWSLQRQHHEAALGVGLRSVEPHVLVLPRAQSCQEARACAQGGVWQI